MLLWYRQEKSAPTGLPRRKCMAKRKRFIVGLMLPLLLCALGSCASTIKYHATLFDNAETYIREDFVAANPVAVTDSSSNTDPRRRVFLVNNTDQYNEIFSEKAKEIKMNLGAQMMVVYTFVHETKRGCDLKEVTLQNEELTFVFEQKETLIPIGDACMPYQRWFLVVLDHLDATTATFQEKRG
jgi:hypothetical protein